MRKFFCSFLLILITTTLFSQDLPHIMSEEERALMPMYLQSLRSDNTIVPPSGQLRTPGEWEEIEGLTISWTNNHRPILAQIVKHAQEECIVYINCSDSVAVHNYLLNSGVTPINVKYIIAPFNSIWIRDYGAQSVYKNDVDTLILIDWIYNRPRPLDNAIPGHLSAFTGIPLYQTTQPPHALVHTGGNFMSDGFGTAFSSNLILDENPSLTNTQVDQIMFDFMGINRYIKMINLPYDNIHHIDMHMKLLDEETLLVGEYPVGVADGPQIEANLLYVLSNYNSVFGTPYKLVRIPMPPDSTYHYRYPDQQGYYLTYTNSVFVNRSLLVPTYYKEYDTTALRILRENLPGYNVIGIPCYSIIPSSGAIHCITNSVASRDPLLISHQKADSMDVLQGITISARIQHRSGISSSQVYFRFDTLSLWQTVSMILTDSTKHTWEAGIPVPIALSNSLNPMYYYISAVSNTSKQQYRPITAPNGYFTTYLNNQTYIGKKFGSRSFYLHPPFPNPASAITCVPFESSGGIIGELKLYNAYGQLIGTLFSGSPESGKHHYFFNASGLPSGVYLVSFSSDSGKQSRYIVVR